MYKLQTATQEQQAKKRDPFYKLTTIELEDLQRATERHLNDTLKCLNTTYTDRAKAVLEALRFRSYHSFKPKPTKITILGANFGGREINKLATALYMDDGVLRIDSNNMCPLDPWSGNAKQLSILHLNENEMRLFVCADGTGEHFVGPGPRSNSSGRNTCMNVEASKYLVGKGTKYEIIAIVYGPAIIVDERAIKYVIGCLDNGTPVEWSDFYMCCDPWLGHSKSGVVFYRYAGNPDSPIWQSSGRQSAHR